MRRIDALKGDAAYYALYLRLVEGLEAREAAHRVAERYPSVRPWLELKFLRPQRKDPMTKLRDAALEDVRHALADEGIYGAAEHAETLVAIAEHYGVRIEQLCWWIHIRTPGKEWSAAEWRAWCIEYTAAIREESEREVGR